MRVSVSVVALAGATLGSAVVFFLVRKLRRGGWASARGKGHFANNVSLVL